MKITKERVGLVVGAAVPMVMYASNAFAVGVANTAVSGAMSSLSDDVVATIGAIIPFALAVFAIIFAVKMGKRVFASLAK